jgi:hypothetical protein
MMYGVSIRMQNIIKMINKKIRIGIIAVLFLSLTHCQVDNKVNYRVIRVENGWGYELYNQERIVIHQEIIPVIEGNNPFLSRKDARKTGKLALQKLYKGRIPVITRQDLDSLKILYPETDIMID